VVLYRRTNQRALRLRRSIEGLRPPLDAASDRLVAFVAIECLSLWSNFTRSFYLSCVHGAKRASGGRVLVTVAGIHSNFDALNFSRSQFAYRRHSEPVWHETKTLLKLLRAAGASNLPQVQSALSVGPQVFKYLPTVRNFFAHRCDETFKKSSGIARQLGVGLGLRPCEIVCSQLPGRPQNVLADWIDDMRNVIELACR
jgi:hypothetical protein